MPGCPAIVGTGPACQGKGPVPINSSLQRFRTASPGCKPAMEAQAPLERVAGEFISGKLARRIAPGVPGVYVCAMLQQYGGHIPSLLPVVRVQQRRQGQRRPGVPPAVSAGREGIVNGNSPPPRHWPGPRIMRRAMARSPRRSRHALDESPSRRRSRRSSPRRCRQPRR